MPRYRTAPGAKRDAKPQRFSFAALRGCACAGCMACPFFCVVTKTPEISDFSVSETPAAWRDPRRCRRNFGFFLDCQRLFPAGQSLFRLGRPGAVSAPFAVAVSGPVCLARRKSHPERPSVADLRYGIALDSPAIFSSEQYAVKVSLPAALSGPRPVPQALLRKCPPFRLTGTRKREWDNAFTGFAA